MTINIKTIQVNANKVIRKMQQMQRYSFDELQRFTALHPTELCLALMSLIQKGTIKQNRDEMGVYYALY